MKAVFLISETYGVDELVFESRDEHQNLFCYGYGGQSLISGNLGKYAYRELNSRSVSCSRSRVLAHLVV